MKSELKRLQLSLERCRYVLFRPVRTCLDRVTSIKLRASQVRVRLVLGGFPDSRAHCCLSSEESASSASSSGAPLAAGLVTAS